MAIKKQPTKPPACDHPRLIPIEYHFGTITQSNPGEPFEQFLDWNHAQGMSARRMRVSRLYCPKCQAEIKVPMPRKFHE